MRISSIVLAVVVGGLACGAPSGPSVSSATERGGLGCPSCALLHDVSAAQKVNIVADSFWLMRHRKISDLGDPASCGLDDLAAAIKCSHSVESGFHIFRSQTWYVERSFEPWKATIARLYESKKSHGNLTLDDLMLASRMLPLRVSVAEKEFPSSRCSATTPPSI